MNIYDHHHHDDDDDDDDGTTTVNDLNHITTTTTTTNHNNNSNDNSNNVMHTNQSNQVNETIASNDNNDNNNNKTDEDRRRDEKNLNSSTCIVRPSSETIIMNRKSSQSPNFIIKRTESIESKNRECFLLNSSSNNNVGAKQLDNELITTDENEIPTCVQEFWTTNNLTKSKLFIKNGGGGSGVRSTATTDSLSYNEISSGKLAITV
mgnify:FL=1